MDNNISECIDSIATDSNANYAEEIIMEYTMNEKVGSMRSTMENKRDREEQEEDLWTEVKNRNKKFKEQRSRIEMYISSKDKLPKQFALAKLFKEHGIDNIIRVKYINAYKIRVDVTSELSAEKLDSSKELADMGWNVHKALENKFSYGVIKNVDLDLKEEEMINKIRCNKPAELFSLNRLKRRGNDTDGWVDSEAVKLCFKGSFLPAYVYVEGLRIQVEPYIFPVSQCSRCWKLGHTAQRCPSSKIICPKCGDKHANCDTNTFQCVNCGGSHMALMKTCPMFLKEKRLREIMAEFNCTYRKALTIYVTPSSPITETVPTTKLAASIKTTTYEQKDMDMPPVTLKNLFSDVIKIQPKESKKNNLPLPRKKKFIISEPLNIDEVSSPIQNESPEIEASQESREETINERATNFEELLMRIKEIIFLSRGSIADKIKNVIKCCIEWLILLLVGNVADWPWLKTVIDFING